MTDSLAAFLRARFAEDEQTARATEHADGPRTLHWRLGGGRVHFFNNGRSDTYSAVFCGDWDRIQIARDDVLGFPVAAHIARHDPARVLAEVEAKRRLAAHYVAVLEKYGHLGDENHLTFYLDGVHTAVKILALSFADHPDYREEWKP